MTFEKSYDLCEFNVIKIAKFKVTNVHFVKIQVIYFIYIVYYIEILFPLFLFFAILV